MDKFIYEAFLQGIYNGYMASQQEDWDQNHQFELFIQQKGLTNEIIGKWVPQKIDSFAKDIIDNHQPTMANFVKIFYLNGCSKGYKADKIPPTIDFMTLKETTKKYIKLFNRYK